MRGLVRLAAAALVMAGAGAAMGDVIIPDPEGTKRVEGTIELDWGVFAGRVSRVHVVKEGDTLRGLARTYYDDAERWKEIAADNENTLKDPDALNVGMELFIPPREAPPDSPDDAEQTSLRPRYVALWMESYQRFRVHAVRRAGVGPVPEAYRKGGTLYLLLPERAGAVLAALAKGETPVPDESWAPTLSVHLFADTLVAADDPAVRVTAYHRLKGRERQLVRSDVVRKRFAADGKRVTKAYPFEREGWHGSGQEEAPPDDEDGDGSPSDDDTVRVLRDLPPPDDGPGRWAPGVGGLVALLGLGIVLGVAIRRRRRAA